MKGIATILFISLACMAQAQNFTNKGKEFWVGYGHHQYMEPGCSSGETDGTNDMNMVLYLSAEQPATVTVTIDNSAFVPALWWRRTYNIPANTVIATENLPKGPIDAGPSGSDPNFDARLYTYPPPAGTGGEGIFRRKGIHIESNVPIVAYAHIFGSVSSAATMLLPVDTWGYSYTSVNSEQRDADRSYSFMYVIAKENNTVVEITPSAPSRLGKAAGAPFQVALQKGEIYQLIAQSDCPTGDGLQLTGSSVKSVIGPDGQCHQVAVFAGSSRTGGETLTCGTGSGRDNDMQQLFPEQAWGRLYLTAPFSKASGSSLQPNQFQTSVYKVVVKDPATQVKRNGNPIPATLLVNNKYYIFSSSNTEYIEADKPVMVAQFMSGTFSCNGGDGDPEMVILSPIEQAIKNIGFYRNTKEFINSNYLTLIVPTAGLPSLRIDNSAVFSHTYPHSYPGYSVVVKGWPAAQAQCLVKCDSGFTAITYGLGGAESYGYNAGTFLRNLNAISDIHNEPDTANQGKNRHLFTCTNTPVRLSALIRYQPVKLVWNISSLGGVVAPNANVTMDPASLYYQGTTTVNGIVYYKYTLPGTYTFNAPGIYSIPIRSTSPVIDNCNNTEEVTIDIEVKAQPTADFTFTHPTGCIKDTVLFTGPGSSGNYNIGQWRWSFPDGSIDSIQNPKKAFTAAGTQTVQLRVVTTDGCLTDASKPVTIFAIPVATASAAPTAVCEGGSITYSETSGYGGPAPISTWYWDFGGGAITTVPNGSSQTKTYAAYGAHTVKHVVKVSDLCVSDTATVNVTVYAKPNLSFTYPAGCLPTDGIVQFNSTTTTPDAQTINAWSWNFGDPNATPANPNTSTDANPVHTYSFGSYIIHYSATTVNGCTKDTTVAASFNIRPMLAYGALTPVCASVTTPISVATAVVTNGVTGGGVYSGAGTSANGQFNPSVAGPGTHTITYTFTSGGGCTESITSTIEVYPKPVAAFTASDHVCLGQAASFTDQSTLSTGSITAWKWNFGDGTQVTNTNNNPFTRTYTSYANYAVQLVAVSDMGCTSDTATHLVAVHPLPVTDFSLPAAVCMPGGTAVFTNQTTVADNSGMTYEWNFGDGSPLSNAQHGNHVYAASGSYPVRLRAVSGWGCSSAITKTARNFFDKPIAQFTVAPDTLCQGSDNVFTDESTSNNSNITKWEWNFGDGTTSSQRNPVKRYASPGYYNVQLIVTNNAGCTSNNYSKQVTVYLQPVIDAGPSYVVPQGTRIIFNPKANDSTVLAFHWSPVAGLSNANSLRPSLVAMYNETYTLRAIGEGNCTAEDFLTVKILKPVTIPNAFSPNGDGIHDKWEITNLSDYPGCTVEVFNRYGQRVYYSGGYGTPWDGTVSGKTLPVATYYYVIHLKNGFAPRTGSVTILK